ncbi:hypothetical protein ABKV19_014643 [Rosa sericea]
MAFSLFDGDGLTVVTVSSRVKAQAEFWVLEGLLEGLKAGFDFGFLGLQDSSV